MNSLYGIPKTFQFVNLKLSIPYVTFFMPYRLNYIFLLIKINFQRKVRFLERHQFIGTLIKYFKIVV